MPISLVGLTYADVKSWLTDALAGEGYSTTLPLEPEAKPMPLIHPGPFSLAQLQDLSPQSIVFATVGNGAGLTDENLFEQPFITIRTIGLQGDYDGAEALAMTIDRLLLAITGNAVIGATKVLYVTRSGGGPQLIDYDSSDRYHFQTTYVVRSQTGL